MNGNRNTRLGVVEVHFVCRRRPGEGQQDTTQQIGARAGAELQQRAGRTEQCEPGLRIGITFGVGI